MTVALALPTLELSEDDQRIVVLLRGRIRRFAKVNKRKNDYYELKQKIRHLDIAVPPHLRGMLEAAIGWPGTAADVLEERLDWLGWSSVEDTLGLEDVFRDNELAIESGGAHLEALITGTDFVTVGKGSAGEPEVLVTVESPSSATALWDYRKRRTASALSQTRDESGAVVMETLYLPNSTIRFERNDRTRKLEVVDRDDHKLERVMMARMVNRTRASEREGRSEITRAVRYYTDAALRTLLGMEVNREFYTAPQWYAINAYPEQFGVDSDASPTEKVRAGWAVTMGRMNVIPPNEDDEKETKIQQTTSSPPTPYIEQLRAYSQLLSAETGIPPDVPRIRHGQPGIGGLDPSARVPIGQARRTTSDHLRRVLARGRVPGSADQRRCGGPGCVPEHRRQVARRLDPDKGCVGRRGAEAGLVRDPAAGFVGHLRPGRIVAAGPEDRGGGEATSPQFAVDSAVAGCGGRGRRGRPGAAVGVEACRC